MNDATARVLAQIRSGDPLGLEEIASQLGMTDRHLRRLFVEEFGLPPVAFAQTARLLFAKQLLQDTSHSTTEIAFSAGFGSLRRLHALFRSRYGLTPGEIRGKRVAGAAGDAIRLRLSYRPPFAWKELLAFLAPRLLEGVDAVVDGMYMRTVSLDGRQGWVTVQPATRENALIATVPSHLSPVLRAILSRLRRLFDLDSDPVAISEQLGEDPFFQKLLESTPGLRIPGAWDGFELAVRAILGQQVTVRGASTLAARLTARFGTAIETPHAELSFISPTAHTIADAKVEDIAAIGLPCARAETIHTLAKAVTHGLLRLDGLADPFMEMETLMKLRGLGDWTVQYVAMRALAWPDAFPAGDLGLRKAFGRGTPIAARALLEQSDAWRPWRAYAAMYLWRTL